METGWPSAKLVIEEMEGSSSRGLGMRPRTGSIFEQLGSSVQSSLVDLDDQVLGLAPLARITTQVTPNPRILWFSISQQHGCLLKSFGVPCHHAHLPSYLLPAIPIPPSCLRPSGLWFTVGGGSVGSAERWNSV